MTLLVSVEAIRDLSNATRWYEVREAGLGDVFISEIEALFSRIEVGPKRYRFAYRGLRRALCRRFPYAIYFSERDNGVIVIAILHQRQSFTALAKR
jgi:plasmid stabilization system protein ParE